jgi:branched-chain amino acid transport system ATP-binding protein
MTGLGVRGLTKQFGGVTANRDISFDVRPGELVGVIGPNGAGKSTLFDLITGFTRPDAGEVRLDDRPLTGLRPDQISRLGVARTFQKLRPFAGMTVLENVMVGSLQHLADVEAARASARDALAQVGLADRAHAYARALSTGQRKRLELARALATGPRLLLLDEVTGGVDQATIPGLVRLVRDCHARGLSLIVIEHNMRVIMDISERIVALQLGQVIATGTPAEIRRDRRVIDAYLGETWRTEA